ncbi:MAG: NAD-dependent epimerase/dehydratase family protein [Chthoniobacterales bacterium]
MRVNVEGTLNLLDACAAAGVKRVVVASTGAVYADSPHSLTANSVVAPIDIYGWSKWFAEELCRAHPAGAELGITIARLFNTFGPRETNAHVVPEIVQQIWSGETIRLGNTTAQRDYIYVRDCASALVRLSRADDARALTVNVGTGEAVSVAELVELMGDILGRNLFIEADPRQTQARR